MKQPIEIIEPEIKILKALPSTGGNIECFMTIFDKTAFPVKKYGNLKEWIQENENYISDIIGDDGFEYPIYVVHSSVICEGDEIVPLEEQGVGIEKFSTNTMYYESSLKSHCIAIKEAVDLLYIKSGFHYWSACGQKGYDGPCDYDSMSQIYGGEYSFLSVDRTRFWPIYQSALKIWTEQVTNERAVRMKERFERYEQSIST